MSLAAKQQQLTEFFTLIDDPQERLAVVVERARRLARLADSERTEAHRVRGCTSQVWVVGEFVDGRCHFHADADSPLVRGLVALLADFFSDATPEEIVACDTDPLARLDLIRNLSPTRRHGLASVLAALRAFATSSVNTLDTKSPTN